VKNYVPLVVAVLLGVAAVLAVRRLILRQREVREHPVSVVAVERDVNKGERLTADSLRRKEVPRSARPRQAIPWADRERVEDLEVRRSIRAGDYLLFTDVGQTRSLGALLARQEWGVTINVVGGVADLVQPGDEVAVIATMRVEQEVPAEDLGATPGKETKDVTLVLFPRVRVLDTGNLSNTEETDRRIIVGLPPRDAQVLIAAQRCAELTLALRHPGDETSLNRVDAGVVEDDTFADLLKGLETVTVPKTVTQEAGK